MAQDTCQDNNFLLSSQYAYCLDSQLVIVPIKWPESFSQPYNTCTSNNYWTILNFPQPPLWCKTWQGGFFRRHGSAEAMNGMTGTTALSSSSSSHLLTSTSQPDVRLLVEFLCQQCMRRSSIQFPIHKSIIFSCSE